MVIVGFQAIDVAFIDYNMAGKNGLQTPRRDAGASYQHACRNHHGETSRRKSSTRPRALKATFVPKPIVAEKTQGVRRQR